MTRRATRSAEAEEDLIAIWTYIASNNRAAADKLLERIDAACMALTAFPGLGVSRESIGPGLRSHTVGRYLILYREVDGGVDIVRVFHGARDWQRLL